jgi:hypothetical protein
VIKVDPDRDKSVKVILSGSGETVWYHPHDIKPL